MICETFKPAHSLISNDKSATSAENAEHKKGQSVQTSASSENKFFTGKQNNCLVIV